LGGTRLRIADAEATAAVEVPTAAVLSALSPLGAGWLTCRPDQLDGQQSVGQQSVSQQSGGPA